MLQSPTCAFSVCCNKHTHSINIHTHAESALGRVCYSTPALRQCRPHPPFYFHVYLVVFSLRYSRGASELLHVPHAHLITEFMHLNK